MAIGIFWLIMSVRNWQHILPVQNYIGGIIFFLMIEMAIHYGYWQDYNNTGVSCT